MSLPLVWEHQGQTIWFNSYILPYPMGKDEVSYRPFSWVRNAKTENSMVPE